ncbi:hypothetical protein CEQ21_24495 [Niallia circulans]|uniref:Uncharacterized protein n=1 Tax=Niallia circulans TaxID=1397 RepID=A0A553SNL0_NIACI|nr:hypothetical protein CEQ21_24495 [Niallia circulans]
MPTTNKQFQNGEISFGQKVIYKSKIHFCFFNHENGLLEILDPNTKSIFLVREKCLLYRIK